MKKIFSLIVGLLCAAGTTFADNVTLGRTIPFTATDKEYVTTTVTNTTTELADGTGKTDKSGKKVWYKSPTEVTMTCPCYRNNDGRIVDAYKATCFAGFKTTLADGYKFELSTINVKVATGYNFSYRIEVVDKDSKSVYTSSDYTITNYNKNNSTNADVTITLETAVKLTGNFTVRLHYWTAGTTSGKYLVPLELTATGNLAQDKAVASTTTAITAVKVNDNAISAADLATLTSTKSLTLADKFKEAPTVVFTQTTTKTYTDNTQDVSSKDVSVVATEGTDKYTATTTIGEDVYTVYLGVDNTKEFTANVTSFALVSDKADVAKQEIKVKALNFAGDATVTTSSEVAGLTIPATLTLEDGKEATLTVSYTSAEDVPEASANLIIALDDQKITIPFTYSSTKAVTEIEKVTGGMTWDFTTAGTADIESPNSLVLIPFANKDGFSDGFGYQYLEAAASYFYRSNYKCYQGSDLHFITTVPGTITVEFSNTGGNPARTAKVNDNMDETKTSTDGKTKNTVEFHVAAGDVNIVGYDIVNKVNNYIRIYNVKFVADETKAIKLSAAGMGTFSSTTAYELPEGLTAYTATCDGNKVTLTKVEDGIVAANQGVVLSGEKNGQYTLTPSTKESTTDWTKNELKNTASKEYTTAADDQSTYVLIANAEGNGQFARLNGGQTIPVGKAYLTVDANAAKTLSLSFGETNGINAVENNAEQNGAYYTLSGQQTVKPVKGLYIHNGKKYIAK